MEKILVKTLEELKQCLAIRREVFIEEQGVSEDLEIDEMDASPDACDHILIRHEGQPVATGRLRAYQSDTAKLQRIAVRKQVRGTGIGRILMKAIEEQAIVLGFSYALLDSQCQAEDFYKKAGYVTISEETFLDAGIPHVRMKKRLD